MPSYISYASSDLEPRTLVFARSTQLTTVVLKNNNYVASSEEPFPIVVESALSCKELNCSDLLATYYYGGRTWSIEGL
jgi:hypothetical protein